MAEGIMRIDFPMQYRKLKLNFLKIRISQISFITKESNIY